MAVSLTPRFNKEEVKRQLAARVALIEQALLLRLQRVGETFVTNARNNGNYKDQTGNLRSSIGYLILNRGKQISQSFPGSKRKGATEARKIARQAADKYGQSMVLIVVAGMNYAASVEPRGKDVISGSSLIAKEDLRKTLEQFGKKLG